MIRMGKRGPDKQFEIVIRTPATPELRDEAKAVASAEKVSLSEFIREAIRRHIRARRKRQPSD